MAGKTWSESMNDTRKDVLELELKSIDRSRLEQIAIDALSKPSRKIYDTLRHVKGFSHDLALYRTLKQHVKEKKYYDSNRHLILTREKQRRDSLTGFNLAWHKFSVKAASNWKSLYGLCEDDIGEMLIRQNNVCNGCAVKLDPMTASIDHVIPRCDGGSHTKENFQLLCLPCNKAKGQMSMAQFVSHCQKIVDANRLRLENK